MNVSSYFCKICLFKQWIPNSSWCTIILQIS